AHAAVGKHGNSARDRVGNRRECMRARQGSIELSAAVIGNDDAAGAARGRSPRVIGIENTLDHQRPVPLRTDPLDILPGDACVEVAVDPRLEIVERRAFSNHGFEVSKTEWPAMDCNVPKPSWPG